MRLWSLHPKYLDASGLTACWRESLLAKQVLLGKTRGYRLHPQLERFRQTLDPVAAINAYLNFIFAEAQQRGYRFDSSKMDPIADSVTQMPVTSGQLDFERLHLLEKLKTRSPHLSHILEDPHLPEPHPSFYIVRGEPEPWEKRQVCRS